MKVVVHIQSGRISNPSEVREVFQNLPDGKYLLSLRDYTHRSNNQNAFYWALCEALAVPLEGLGWGKMTKEDVHDFLKDYFLRVKVENGDQFYYKTRSTTELNTEEFNDYLAKIQKLAAELGI